MINVFLRVIVVLCLLLNKQISNANWYVESKTAVCTDSSEIIKTIDSIIKNKKSDREKVRAIYQWVRTNISYDYQQEKTYGTGDFQDKSIESTFNSRKGICIDYARLTCFMLSAAKIKCEVISGFGRFDEKDFFGLPADLLHAWNAVFLDNQWLFMDPTWAGRSINNDLIDDYFLQSPEAFIFTHFPEDNKWQLLKQSLTYDDFEQLPIVKSRFYTFIKTSPPKKGSYTTTNDFIVIDNLPIDSKMVEKLKIQISNVSGDNFESADFSLIQQGGKSYLKVNIREKGKYYIRISGKQKEEDDLTIYVNLITFFVERK